MDLFSSVSIKNLPGTPLAEKLRPSEFVEFVGQEKAISQVESYFSSGFLPSLILWGPPGTGKTTLAKLISKHFDFTWVALNAVEVGAKELREYGEQARVRRIEQQRRTLLFVDEIHRFNKAQQDVLLPFIEKGELTLIGATTENPSYELNRALLSRCCLIVLERLSPESLASIVKLAAEKEGASLETILSEQAQAWLVDWSDGDARRLLTLLEEVFSWKKDASVKLPISLEEIQSRAGQTILGYDKKSDQHYDVISAFIKSLRGSDADAALYYLARMIKSGEDVQFIARRLVIFASEDIGNADPRSLQVAVDGAKAVEIVGLPEAAINLSQVVCYLASAPKSNRSYVALHRANEFVDKTGTQPVPLHLRSSKTQPMKNLGYGAEYQYPHDSNKGWVEQSYWPENIKPETPFYEPSSRGFEKQIKEYKEWLKKD